MYETLEILIGLKFSTHDVHYNVMQYWKRLEINAATSLRLRAGKCAVSNPVLVVWTCDKCDSRDKTKCVEEAPLFTSTSKFLWISDKAIVCSKFWPSVSSEEWVLYELYKRDFVAIWDKLHQHAFDDFKKRLNTSSAVAFYTVFQFPRHNAIFLLHWNGKKLGAHCFRKLQILMTSISILMMHSLLM